MEGLVCLNSVAKGTSLQGLRSTPYSLHLSFFFFSPPRRPRPSLAFFRFNPASVLPLISTVSLFPKELNTTAQRLIFLPLAASVDVRPFFIVSRFFFPLLLPRAVPQTLGTAPPGEQNGRSARGGEDMPGHSLAVAVHAVAWPFHRDSANVEKTEKNVCVAVTLSLCLSSCVWKRVAGEHFRSLGGLSGERTGEFVIRRKRVMASDSFIGETQYYFLHLP